MLIFLSVVSLSFYVSIVLYSLLLPPLPSNLSFIQVALAIQLLSIPTPFQQIQRAENHFNYTEECFFLSPKCIFSCVPRTMNCTPIVETNFRQTTRFFNSGKVILLSCPTNVYRKNFKRQTVLSCCFYKTIHHLKLQFL